MIWTIQSWAKKEVLNPKCSRSFSNIPIFLSLIFYPLWEWYKQLPSIYHVLKQENSSVLFIGSPNLLCVQEPIFYLPLPLTAILSSSHLVLSALGVLAFEKGWEILADNTGAKRKQRKLLTKIKLQLCSCWGRVWLCPCGVMSRVA